MMNADPNEYDLACRARSGDRIALAELVERTRMALFALAYAELRHYDDAQDAVASALLQIVQHIQEVREPSRIRAWMQSVVRNEARRIRRRRTTESSIDEVEPGHDETPPAVLRLDIERALQRLPGDQERAIRLFYLRDLSVGEIARRLGRSEGTIKSWLQRGRERLARQMEGYEPMTTPATTPAAATTATRTAAIVHSDLDPSMVQQIADALGACGYDTEVVVPTELEKLTEHLGRYPLLVMDETVAGCTVFAILTHLRSNPRTQGTPLCVLCTTPSAFLIHSFWGAGASAVVDKADPQQLATLKQTFEGMRRSMNHFTEAAWAVTNVHLQEEGAYAGVEELGPQEFLLALLCRGDSIAVQLLTRLGVTPDALRAAIRAKPAAAPPSPGALVRFAAATEAILDEAEVIAQSLQHRTIGTEHYLLALLDRGDAAVTQRLAELGVTAESARAELLKGGFAPEAQMGRGPVAVTLASTSFPIVADPTDVPDVLPLLAIRDKVYFPHMVFPIYVGRDRSVAALQMARAGSRLLFLTAQRETQVDQPGEADLYPIGVVAQMLHLLQLPDGSIRALLQGCFRARIQEFVGWDPAIQVRTERLTETVEPQLVSRVGDFLQEARAAERRQGLPSAAAAEASRFADQPGRVADIITPYLSISVAEQQSILETLAAGDRLQKVKALLSTA